MTGSLVLESSLIRSDNYHYNLRLCYKKKKLDYMWKSLINVF